MQIRNFSLPVAIVTLSLLIDSTDAVPVKHLIKRDADLAGESQVAKRNVVIKRGYYVGGRKGASGQDKVKRDRFAPYGYPVSVVRRDNNGSSAGDTPSKLDDDDVRTATSVQASNPSATSKSSGNATDSAPSSKPSTPPPGSNNGTTITLPKGVTAATSGFLFIPVSQAAAPSTASNSSNSNSASTQSSPAPSITRQTFYINIEAGLGGAAQTVQVEAVNGKPAAPKTNGTSSGTKNSDDSKSGSKDSSGDSGNNGKGDDSHPKPKSNDKQASGGGGSGDDDGGNKQDKDDKSQKPSQPGADKTSSKDNKQSSSSSDGDDKKGDDDDGKDSSKSSSSSSSSKSDKSADTSNNSTDVRKIIFKPLQDPDQDSGNKTISSSTLDVKGADKAETQDLKDVNSGDDKKAAGNDKSSDKSSGKSDDQSSSISSSSASNSTSSSKQSSDNYFLFPVDKDKQQVDLAKGDMIAYVEHPESAAKSINQKQSRDVNTPSDDNAGYHRRSYGSLFEAPAQQKRSGDFARRAKEFFKRNLVKGKPGVRPEYWTGQKYDKQSRSSHDEPASFVEVRANDDGSIFIKRSGLDQHESNDNRPIFFLVKRDPEESLKYAERLSRRFSDSV